MGSVAEQDERMCRNYTQKLYKDTLNNNYDSCMKLQVLKDLLLFFTAFLFSKKLNRGTLM